MRSLCSNRGSEAKREQILKPVYGINEPRQRLRLRWFERDDWFTLGAIPFSTRTELEVGIDFDEHTYTFRWDTNVQYSGSFLWKRNAYSILGESETPASGQPLVDSGISEIG